MLGGESPYVFYPSQRMTRMEALKSYTANGAFAAFEENVKGTLKPGKYADIVVLSKNILTIPEDEIPTAQVSSTIVGEDQVQATVAQTRCGVRLQPDRVHLKVDTPAFGTVFRTPTGLPPRCGCCAGIFRR